MPNEKEIAIIQKAAMFDLIQIIKKQPDKTYTADELEALIVAYITGAEQYRFLARYKMGPGRMPRPNLPFQVYLKLT